MYFSKLLVVFTKRVYKNNLIILIGICSIKFYKLTSAAFTHCSAVSSKLSNKEDEIFCKSSSSNKF